MQSKKYRAISAYFKLEKEYEQVYQKYRKHTYAGKPTKWRKRFDERELQVEEEYKYQFARTMGKWF